MKTIKTKIHFFSFNTENREDRTKWENLYKELRSGLGLKPFVLTGKHLPWGNTIEEDNRTEELTLETEHIFSDQWNGSCDSLKSYRIFDWAIYEFPNKKIIRGYWVEPTYETMDIRGQFKCRYCGKIVGYNPDGNFHVDCFSSEYLKEIRLTAFKRIHEKTPKEIEEIPTDIFMLYWQKQRETWRTKFLEMKQDNLDKAISRIKSAETEHMIQLFLLDHFFTDFDNLIFYDHKNEFCFGWRKSYNKEEAEKLQNLLENIGFEEKFGKFTIKKY